MVRWYRAATGEHMARLGGDWMAASTNAPVVSSVKHFRGPFQIGSSLAGDQGKRLEAVVEATGESLHIAGSGTEVGGPPLQKVAEQIR